MTTPSVNIKSAGTNEWTLTITPTPNTINVNSNSTITIGYNTSPPTPPPSGSAGILIPYYIYPTSSSLSALLAPFKTYTNVPLIVVLNPDSGVGTSIDDTYVNAVQTIANAGAQAFGYVYTSYGSRPISQVEAEINTYISWYGVSGIFFDEEGSNANYYAQLTAYAKSKGIKTTIANPGTFVSPSTFSSAADITVIGENGSFPSTSSISSWSQYPASKSALIAYDQRSLPSSLSSYLQIVGWIYVTNANLPNPYDVLPSYWTAFVQTISSLNSGITG